MRRRSVVLGGQQRTISLSQYANGDFTVNVDGNLKGFPSLTDDEQQRFLDYELLVYRYKGTDSEKLDWFRLVIAGVQLEDQELPNATYCGPWLTHAKSIFSKTGGAAYGLGEKYLVGEPIREKPGDRAHVDLRARRLGHHKEYVAVHKHNQNANELWSYFGNVIYWVEDTVTNYRAKQIKGQPWGPFFSAHGGKPVYTDALEGEIAELVQDREVTNKRGIYPYVLTAILSI